MKLRTLSGLVVLYNHLAEPVDASTVKGTVHRVIFEARLLMSSAAVIMSILSFPYDPPCLSTAIQRYVQISSYPTTYPYLRITGLTAP